MRMVQKSTFSKTLILLVGLAGLAALATFTNTQTSSNPTAALLGWTSEQRDLTGEQFKKKSSKILAVEEISEEYDGLSTVYTGTVKNNTERTYKGIKITINLYDKDKVMIGNAFAIGSGLKPGGEWEFQARSLLKESELEQVEYYELSDVTGL